MNISEVMNKVMVISGDESVREASKIMSDKGIGCLVILKNDRIEGILTERDILRNIDRLNSRVSSVMSKKVITINEHESMDSAAELMTANKIKKLPVVNGKKLVGIVTATDLVANSDFLNENFLLG